jgi:hypothetical protein
LGARGPGAAAFIGASTAADDARECYQTRARRRGGARSRCAVQALLPPCVSPSRGESRDAQARRCNHHIREEEQQIFPALEKTGVDLEALGQELAEQRKAIEAGKRMPERNRAGSPAPEPRRDAQKPGTSERDHAEHEQHEQQPRDTTKADRAYMKAHGDELAASVKRAKRIHSVDEHEDHAGQTLVTRNHAVIRQWAEARGGKPATVGSPKEGERPRVLRFDFPDYDKGLQAIDWDAWLRVFDERNLVFLFQKHRKAGNESNFFILNSPEREDG